MPRADAQGELLLRRCEATAGAAQRVGGSHDEREADAIREGDGLVDAVHGQRLGHGLADADAAAA